ncbi:MAG: hypothetical protein IT159_12790 [Bryobacterales bacterium]|jgi:phage terminase small subunit|nr:hypothetical protein [Bryobacterales bacterium]
MKKTLAPRRLSPEARKWYSAIVSEYAIEDRAGLLLLHQAAEAFDRLREAQAIIARDGLLVQDRFKQKKSHPLLLVERDSRLQLIKCLRMLNLDLEIGK